MILTCTCSSSFQDKTYGTGKRVHNFAKKANGGHGGYRCTVCLKVKSMKDAGQSDQASDEKEK